MGKASPDPDPDLSMVFTEDLKKEFLSFMENETSTVKETIQHLTQENEEQKKTISNLIARIEALERPRPYAEVAGASIILNKQHPIQQKQV